MLAAAIDRFIVVAIAREPGREQTVRAIAADAPDEAVATLDADDARGLAQRIASTPIARLRARTPGRAASARALVAQAPAPGIDRHRRRRSDRVRRQLVRGTVRQFGARAGRWILRTGGGRSSRAGGGASSGHSLRHDGPIRLHLGRGHRLRWRHARRGTALTSSGRPRVCRGGLRREAQPQHFLVSSPGRGIAARHWSWHGGSSGQRSRIWPPSLKSNWTLWIATTSCRSPS